MAGWLVSGPTNVRRLSTDPQNPHKAVAGSCSPSEHETRCETEMEMLQKPRGYAAKMRDLASNKTEGKNLHLRVSSDCHMCSGACGPEYTHTKNSIASNNNSSSLLFNE